MDIREKAALISRYAQEWLRLNQKKEAGTTEVLPYLIEKGLYRADGKSTNPLRDDLKRLKERQLASLVRGLATCEKPRMTQWYFRKV